MSSVELVKLFENLQDEMIAYLTTGRKYISHPTFKGDLSESRWCNWLSKYLPKRYMVSKAIIVDCNGDTSEQIDIVIYDRQYTPFIFNQDEVKYIPAEGVYAVFEVKQVLNKHNLEYAGKKVGSVRKLTRTSSPITHAGGTFPPRKPIPIIGGILSLTNEWKPPFGSPFNEVLSSLSPFERINIGCSLKHGSFFVDYKNDNQKIFTSKDSQSLLFCFLKILEELQNVGTVAAIDLSKYYKIIL